MPLRQNLPIFINVGVDIRENISDPVMYTADAVDSGLGDVRRRLRTVYVPYSDSALTWLLKDCFGLNCCTTLVAS